MIKRTHLYLTLSVLSLTVFPMPMLLLFFFTIHNDVIHRPPFLIFHAVISPSLPYQMLLALRLFIPIHSNVIYPLHVHILHDVTAPFFHGQCYYFCDCFLLYIKALFTDCFSTHFTLLLLRLSHSQRCYCSECQYHKLALSDFRSATHS